MLLVLALALLPLMGLAFATLRPAPAPRFSLGQPEPWTQGSDFIGHREEECPVGGDGGEPQEGAPCSESDLGGGRVAVDPAGDKEVLRDVCGPPETTTCDAEADREGNDASACFSPGRPQASAGSLGTPTLLPARSPARTPVQADADKGYDALFAPGGATEVACWSHARRHFVQAADSDPVLSAEALRRIGELYAVERVARARELKPDQVRALRPAHARRRWRRLGSGWR